MVLVITRNKDILRTIKKYENYNNIYFEKEIQNIDKYVNEELINKNMDLFDKIYIDIIGFNNTNEEILNAIVKIKIIFNIRIIVLAIGFKVGNELLSNLFENGLYDFIIAEDNTHQDEEFRKAIKGNTYINAKKFKVENVNNKSSKKLQIRLKMEKNGKKLKVSKEKLLAFFSLIKNVVLHIFKVIAYIIAMFFISIGATALLNANIRDILFEIIKGGK